MKGLLERHPTAAVVLFFLALSVAMCAPFVFAGRFFLAADFLYRTPLWYDPSVRLHNFDLLDGILIFYPDETLLHDGLRRGVFTLWNPHNLAGLPIFADGQSGYFYPFRLALFLLFSAPVAHDLGILLHLWAAGCAMYFLALRLGTSRTGSVLSGIVWMLNGVATTMLTLEHIILCLPYVPLLILWAERAGRDRRWIAAVALAAGLLVTVGHLQIVLNCFLIVAVATIGRWWTGPRTAGSLVRPFLGLLLGVALAAPVLLPTADLVARSERPIISLDYLIHSQQKFLVGFLPTIWMPDILGTPVDNFAINRVPQAGYFVFLETCAYCGVAPLLLALAGARRRRLGWSLAAFGLLAVLLPATPLYRLLYLIPAFKLINPTRLTLCWVFSVALLAGLGLDAVQDAARRRWLGQIAVALGLIMIATVGALGYLAAHPDQALSHLLQDGLIRLPSREMYLSDGDYLGAVERGFQAVYGPTRPAMALPLLWMAGCCAGLWIGWGRCLWIALACVDLLCFGLRFNTTAPAARIYPATPTVTFLQQNLGYDRVMGVGTIKPNTLLPFDLNDVGGYGSLYAKITSNYWTWNEYGDLDPGHAFGNQVFPLTHYQTPLVNLLGVKYFVCYPQSPLVGYPLVQAEPLPVYENPHRLPRAWMAPGYEVVDESAQLARLSDPQFQPRQTVLLMQEPVAPARSGSGPAGTAQITAYDNNEVAVQTDGPAGFLVLSDTWDPGWKVRVDDQPSPLLRADYLLRSVWVPEGRHVVVFKYAPDSLTWGFRISLAALLLCLLLSALGKNTT